MASITRLRTIAFSFLLLLFLAALLLSFFILKRQKYDATLINIVGRQRMLVQQMTLEAVLARTFPDADYRQALHDTAHVSFEATIIALSNGGQVPLPTGETWRIRFVTTDAQFATKTQTVFLFPVAAQVGGVVVETGERVFPVFTVLVLDKVGAQRGFETLRLLEGDEIFKFKAVELANGVAKVRHIFYPYPPL